MLAILDAGGYDVVADTAQGTTTILARGDSQIALTWTTTAYTVEVSTS